ncbi:MAG: dicarboxylate/amino acid:cation symporter [Bacteroidaceae bacterium]|nr:dicarboxylate/amino acid:cation symporter [Bacteroidaceae bacterium]
MLTQETNTISTNIRNNSHKKDKNRNLFLLISVMILGILFGFALNLLPDNVVTFINDNILYVVRGIFYNTLKLLLAPIVFVSITSSLANMTNLSSLGRITTKMIVIMCITTAVAVLMGIGIGCLFNNTIIHHMDISFANVDVVEQEKMTLQSFLMDFFPTNIVTPISSSNMIQILVISIFFGITLGQIRDKAPKIISLLNELNELINRMLSILMKMLPLVIFCSMAWIVCSYGGGIVTIIAKILLLSPIMMVLMLCVYTIMLSCVAHVSPLPFLRRFFELSIVPFSLCSSAASLPNTINVCNKLGVSKRVSSLTLPLGCTMNMDGSAFSLAAISLCMLNVYGIEMTTSQVITVGLLAFIFSIATPSIPNAEIAIMSSLLATIGAPLELLGLFLGINPISELFDSAINVTSDAAIATTISSTEGLLDKETYYSRK